MVNNRENSKNSYIFIQKLHIKRWAFERGHKIQP